MADETPLATISTGKLNTVNDAVIGMIKGIGPQLRTDYGFQLGIRLEVKPENVAQLFDSTVGTLYGGHFRYVKLAAAAAQPVVGQVLFKDISVAETSYQVTTSESGGADAAIFPAGIYLGTLVPGNYGWVQEEGPIPIKFRAVLTDAGAIGSPIYCAGVGGADLGFADVINDALAASIGNVVTLQRHYLGVAKAAPAGGSLTVVYLKDLGKSVWG